MPAASAVRMCHQHRGFDGLVFRTTSLRTRQVWLRHIDYGQLVVDERRLSRAFPYVGTGRSAWCVVLLRGRLELEGGATAGPGDAVSFGPLGKAEARWLGAAFVELEWVPPVPPTRATTITRSGAPRSQVRALAKAIDDRSVEAKTVLELAHALFSRVGAPLTAAMRRPGPTPTATELRLAAALESQINDLSARATTTHLADEAGLSPRQLQRVVRRFNENFGLNADGWRDVRNRCRVLLAALLLTRPNRDVATIATEVGYATANALGRAFAEVGLPSPARLRRQMLDDR